MRCAVPTAWEADSRRAVPRSGKFWETLAPPPEYGRGRAAAWARPTSSPSASMRVPVGFFRGDTPVPLRPKTWAVLCHLAGRPGQLVTKDDLLAAVWADVAVTEDVLRISIRELRRALGDDPEAPRFIETVHGRGYRFLPRPGPAMGPPADGGAIVVGRDAELGDARRVARERPPRRTGHRRPRRRRRHRQDHARRRVPRARGGGRCPTW